MAKFFNGFTEKQLEDEINKYFVGANSITNLPLPIYEASVAKLNEAIFEGFGGLSNVFDDGTPERGTVERLQHNVQEFSAAKNFQEAQAMTAALFDEDGFVRPFADFQKDAVKIFEQFNEVWLRAEFDTGVNMAFGARQWIDVQGNADIAPFLRYQTIGDEKVRPEHIVLDDIIRPVNDSFWNSFFPPNGWRCRCEVEQIFEDDAEGLVTPKRDLPPKADLPALFRVNPGKKAVIFDKDKHPYFEVPPELEEFKDNNFGLPVPPPPQTPPPNGS